MAWEGWARGWAGTEWAFRGKDRAMRLSGRNCGGYIGVLLEQQITVNLKETGEAPTAVRVQAEWRPKRRISTKSAKMTI